MSPPLESLATLLAAVRTQSAPPLSTHIPSLDPLKPANLIEVQGPPACGKSHFLYYLVINCLLPIALQGWDSIAVILDTELSFDLSRFQVLLISRIKRFLPRADDHAVQDLVQAALDRLHIFKPDSSSQLAVTIYHLPRYVADRFPDRRLGLVAIDSISAFYWPDRYTVQQLQTAHEGHNQFHRHPLNHVFIALRSLHLHWSPVIVLTNWGLVPDPELTKRNPSVQMFKQHLYPFPGPFASNHSTHDNSGLALGNSFQITHHITLSFAPLPRFPRGIDLAEAKSEEEKHRMSLLLKGEITGIVRYPGNTDNTSFTLRIHNDDMTAL
ncbi:hypothetical protein JOM56_006159 [Amanita muscaria]